MKRRWPLLGLLLLPFVVNAQDDLPEDDTLRRKNVIVITADTLRGDMLGVNGNPTVYTPHLDRLAGEGTNYSRAYTAITTTLPSHASLFSGMYPSDHRAFSNVSRLSNRVVTLAEVLDQQGWDTAAHINMPWLNPDTSNVPQGMREIRRGDHVRKADRTWPWVQKYLDKRPADPDPFFLWIHLVDNHTPYHAPTGYQNLYWEGERDTPGETSLEEIWHLFPGEQRRNEHFHKWTDGIDSADYLVASYYGSVTWVDAHVGLLMWQLEQLGIADDTVIVFTADHGESMGEHDLWFVHAGLFEGTTHVPLIIRDPDRPHESVSDVVSLVDVYPTVLESLGLSDQAPEGLRGRSLWSGQVGGAALLEHTGRQLEGVVTERWKLIRHLKTTSIYAGYPMEEDRVELYDLQADPLEQTDLSAAHPDLVLQLSDRIDQLKEGQRDFQELSVEVDDALREQLEAMGYFE